MKITKDELKQLIAEAISEKNSILLEMPLGSSSGTKMHALDNHPTEKDPDGYEGHMAKKSLYFMARQADQLHDMIVDDENLEPWVQAKITKAADYLTSAFEAITYEKDNPKGR
jgi:hypothetical protein|tara:strand:- start:925 stop:1263 length:339 start_codon:yes stop_codon:yes gene_type:complete